MMSSDDLSALGGGELLGSAAIAEAARALGDRNPVAHHVTNIVVDDLSDTAARVVSEGRIVPRTRPLDP